MMEIGSTALSLLLCGIGGVFVGFIDSIAGGGGLVSLPMLLAMGLPPNLAIGTNKLAAACGNVVSSIQFIRAGKTKLSLAWRMIPLALAGSAAGSAFMIYLPEDVLRPLLLGRRPSCFSNAISGGTARRNRRRYFPPRYWRRPLLSVPTTALPVPARGPLWSSSLPW